MEYICNTIEEAIKAMNIARNPGDIFICNDEVFNFICSQPERSKREDHENGCGALNSMET